MGGGVFLNFHEIYIHIGRVDILPNKVYYCFIFIICNDAIGARRITKLMALAYRNMFYPIRHMPSTEEARILSSQIYEKVLESPQERRNKTKDLLKAGDLEKRGLYDEEELNFLIESILTENDLREVAGRTLCALLHKQPYGIPIVF